MLNLYQKNYEAKILFFFVNEKNVQEVVLYRQSEVLIKSGFDVFNVVSDTVPDEVEHGVKILSSGYVTNNRIKRVLFSSKNLRKRLFEVDADIYHTCHIDQLGTCLKLKKAGKKVIFEMQEDHPYSLYWKSRLPHFLNHFFVCLMKLWMSYALKRVDAITCVGYDTYDYLVSWGIDKKKIHVIGNFPIVRKDYKLTREDYMSRENRILYFGLIYSYSRQEVFLEALKKLHVNVKYLVAGKFMGNELKTYRVQTMNNPLWKEKVEFVERFKHDELKDFVAKSTISNTLRDFSVYAHDKRGSLGIIKIFESMENALPILCPDMPVYREMMEKYKCGILVDPMNSQAIADAIEYLVSHKEEAWKMGQEGRRAVIEKYSWDVASKDYLGIVSSLLTCKHTC